MTKSAFDKIAAGLADVAGSMEGEREGFVIYLPEEVDERGTGMPRHRLPEHLARLRVQRGEERQRAVPEIFEAVPSPEPRAESP